MTRSPLKAAHSALNSISKPLRDDAPGNSGAHYACSSKDSVANEQSSGRIYDQAELLIENEGVLNVAFLVKPNTCTTRSPSAWEVFFGNLQKQDQKMLDNLH